MSIPRRTVAPRTLVDLLAERAAEGRGDDSYLFLGNGEEVAEGLGFADLRLRARTLAAALRERVGFGERALLLFPPGLDFIVAFFGCLAAGVVAVPAYPPRRRRLDTVAAIADDARPAVVLTTGALVDRFSASAGEPEPLPPSLAAVPWMALDRLHPGDGEGWDDPAVDADTVAFLQYTSGSTSTPKGVVVRHRNLLHNEEMIRRAFGQSESSVVVSWLPLYHDMGLIGGVLQPLYCGGRCVLMAPLAFLQRPRRWLEAVSRFRATTSGGPDFAYDLCVDRIPEAEREGLDLASWEVAFNGSEPVRAETLERFARAFGPCGFRRRSFLPCYGLAEATLFVTGGGAREEPVVRAFRVDELRRGRGRPVAEDGSSEARSLVGCGRAWMGQEVVVVDPQTSRPVPDGTVGEIWVSGLSVAGGYWRRAAAGGEDFGARLAGRSDSPPFLRTGDLGFVDDGELFVAGRRKDLVILRGRNFHPHDLERTAESAHPDLRPAGAAAFPVTVDGEERLVVVLEVSRHSRSPVEEVAAAVRAALAEVHEVAVYEVVLIRARTLPRTSSGKVRRHACRDAYLEDGLDEEGRHRGGAGAAMPGEGSADADPSSELTPPTVLRQLSADQRVAAVERWLLHHAAALTGLPESSLASGDRPLVALGLDSLAAVELSHRVERSLGIPVSGVELLEETGLEVLARQLAARLVDAPEAGPAEGPEATGPGPHPLSEGQRALWFLSRLAPESSAYHVAAAFRVPADGDGSPGVGLDEEALVGAVTRAVARHPMLRATFHDSGEGPYLRIGSAPRVDLRREDAVGPDGSPLDDAALARRAAALAAEPFDLAAGPPLRLALLRRGDERVVVVVVHHLVSDFWSMAVLARELGPLYRSIRGEGVNEPPLPTAQYLDHVEEERRRLAGEEGETLWRWWRERLEPIPPRLDLPTDRPRPRFQSWKGSEVRGRLGAAAAREVPALARARRATPFQVALAAFALLLARYGDRRDLVVGSPVAGRREPGSGGVVGYYVDPLPLRIDLSGAPPFAELVDRVRSTTLDAIAHQGLPLVRMAERLRVQRDDGSSPLFQAMCVWYQGLRREEQSLASLALGWEGVRADLGGLEVESFPLPVVASQFDVTLALGEVDGELVLSLRYNPDLFDPVTARRMVEGFTRLLAAGAESPETPVERLPLLSAEERRQLVVEWNRTAVDYGGPETLSGRVGEQVRRTPEAPAVRFEGGELSYRELWRRSRRLASALVGLGVGPEVRVAVLADRGPELVVALLGVLEAGGAYLPLDPEHPEERLSTLAEEGLAGGGVEPVLLALAHRAEAVRSWAPQGSRVVVLDAPEAWPEGPERWPSAPPDVAAYALYTSGSTGRPKGVVNSHRGAVNRLRWGEATFPLGPGDRVLHKTPLVFDVSIWELFWPLSVGACLVVVRPGGHREPDHLVRTVREEGVTVLHFVPSLLRVFLEEPGLEGCTSVARVFASGEALAPDLVRRFHRRLGSASPVGAELHNLYGPTEASIEVSWWPCDDPEPAVVPIGRPIANLRLHVLDRTQEPVPAGVPGELYLGGIGVARGYLARPARTASAFLPDPFAAEHGEPGGRLYRTGDLCRQRRDGVVEYLGRQDRQVKLRGFRIEPGEIEATLVGHPAVVEAVVDLTPVPGGQALVCWLVAAPPATDGETGVPSPGELERYLHERLPAWMVPSAFVVLPEMPLNASGKLDRKALPAPGVPAGDRHGDPPRGEWEQRVAAHWCELLGIPAVARSDGFFDLGGQSLSAVQMLGRLRVETGIEVPVRELFADPTLAGLAARLAARATGASAPGADPGTGPPAPAGPRAALSFAQERLWFLDRVEPGNAAYHMPAALCLRGPLDRGSLVRALAEILRRHQVLRSVYRLEGEGPVQVVTSMERVLNRPLLPRIDLAALPEERRGDELARWRRELSVLPFDLERGPVVRFRLVETAPGEAVLLAVFHHVAFDGGSVEVVRRELAALYDAFAAGRPSPLAEPDLQYADHARWQRRQPEERWQADLDHWRRRLAGLPEALELPTDRPRTGDRPHRAGRVVRHLEAGTVGALERFARQAGATPFQVWLAALAAVLGRHGGTSDVAVGVAVSGRRVPHLADAVGFYVNTLVLRLDLGRGAGVAFATLVERARDAWLEAWDHGELPFERLVQELRPERTPGRSPLVQVLLVADDTPQVQSRLALSGLEVEALPLETHRAKMDLTVEVRGTADRAGAGLSSGFSLEYDADLFDAVTADALADRLVRLLSAGLEAPEHPVSRLPLLSPEERHRVVAGWNATARPYGGSELLGDLLMEQVERTPELPALRFEGEELTYRELGDRCHRLASALVALGVGPEVVVGVMAERSPELVMGLHAVVQAGGAYVPLDPEYPRERLAHMATDALQGSGGGGAGVLLAQGRLAERAAALAPPGTRLLVLDEPDGWPVGPASWPSPAPESPAYVIYTSGSTGRPKGVVNRHRAIVNRLRWMQEAFPLDSGDRVMQKTPASFDVSVWELFWPLAVGACLVVARPGGHRDPAWLARAVAREGITTLHFVPSMLQVFLEEPEAARCTALRRVVASGEALPPDLVRRFHRRLGSASPVGAELHNLYGPTEAAVDVSWWPCDDPAPATVPIGHPIANLRLHVLDRALEPVPPGVAGELYLGGVGLARGYHRRSALTAERFVPDPFAGELAAAGERLYRTGDLARHRRDGAVEYLGRTDHQVKLRGFRIELGEIEACLTGHPAVREAAAGLSAGPDPRLVAWVVAAAGEGDGAGQDLAPRLAAHLEERLPPWMVPSVFVELPEMPLNASGKLDRRALPAPATDAAGGAEPPRGPLEEVVAAEMAALLDRPSVGRDQGFFDLGGHSLLAARLVAHLRERLGAELPVREVFAAPTVAGLAARLQQVLRSGGDDLLASTPIRPVPRDRELPLSFAQEGLWFLDRMEPGNPVYNGPWSVLVEGRLQLSALRAALSEVVRRHEVLRTAFVEVDGRPVQRIRPAAPVPLPVVDLSALPAERAEAVSRRQAGREMWRPFDLERDPLLRTVLWRLSGERHRMLVNLHHMVSDAWSGGLLVREAGTLYTAFTQGRPSPLPELPVQYADFAAWQREWLGEERRERLLAWWRRQLGGGLEPQRLPADRPEPERRSLRGGRVPARLEADLAERLRQLAREEGATLFMVLLAALAAVLHGRTGQHDQVLGTDMVNRDHPATEGLVGFFINMLALRLDLSGNPTFRELLRQARDTALGAYAHKALPFEMVVEEVRPERSADTQSPLFRVVLVLDNTPAATLEMPEVRWTPEPVEDAAVVFDLTVWLRDAGSGLEGYWAYRGDLFDRGTVAGLHRDLERVLARAADDPGLRLEDLTSSSAAGETAGRERQTANLDRLRRVRRRRGGGES